MNRCKHCNVHIVINCHDGRWIGYLIEGPCPYGPGGEHAPGHWQDQD